MPARCGFIPRWVYPPAGDQVHLQREVRALPATPCRGARKALVGSRRAASPTLIPSGRYSRRTSPGCAGLCMLDIVSFHRRAAVRWRVDVLFWFLQEVKGRIPRGQLKPFLLAVLFRNQDDHPHSAWSVDGQRRVQMQLSLAVDRPCYFDRLHLRCPSSCSHLAPRPVARQAQRSDSAAIGRPMSTPRTARRNRRSVLTGMAAVDSRGDGRAVPRGEPVSVHGRSALNVRERGRR